MIFVSFDWFNMFKPYNKYPEMEDWMEENIKGTYRRHIRYCDAYEFELEEDAVAFKLRWL